MAKDYDAISEVKIRTLASDIKIYLWTLGVSNMDEKHKENSTLAHALRALNPGVAVTFNENLVGSLSPLPKWPRKGEGVQYGDGPEESLRATAECRAIDLKNPREKELLERLIKIDIIMNSPQDERYERVGLKCVRLSSPVHKDARCTIYRKFDIDVDIGDDGAIIVGLDLSHDINATNSIYPLVLKGKISAGARVKDIYHNSYYDYVCVADYTVSQKNPELGKSIIEYYEDKGESKVIAGLSRNMRAVKVKNSKGEVLPYIPTRLFPVILYSELPASIEKKLKLSPDAKMKSVINTLSYLIYGSSCTRMDSNKKTHDKWVKSGVLVRHLGYTVANFTIPSITFGNSIKKEASFSGIMSGLRAGGPYFSHDTQIRYFIDKSLLDDDKKRHLVGELGRRIEETSREMKVNLTRVSIGDKLEDAVNMDSPEALSIYLNKKSKEGVFKTPTMFVMSGRHLDLQYDTIKRAVGHGGGVATQCMDFDKYSAVSDRYKDSVIVNILLGIYAKSSLTAWTLGRELNSDCFIGLDVSRSNGVNKLAIIHVVGKHGELITSLTMDTQQSGEAVPIQTLKDALIKAVTAFEGAYKKPPAHVTFHRDGICYEDISEMEGMASALGVSYDYVEITKDVNRRMASFTGPSGVGVWKTVMGKCYIKGNSGYLCATNPSQFIGMASPVRVRCLTHNMEFTKIIQDVWNLGFMHIHTLNKPRLPITTHYAHLCSKQAISGYLPDDMSLSCLCFV